jgi:uncharacterized protein YcfL
MGNILSEVDQMKKAMVMILLVMLLQGCGAREVFETVDDEYKPAMVPAAAKISLHLPDEQAQVVMENENQQIIYLYEDFCMENDLNEYTVTYIEIADSDN